MPIFFKRKSNPTHALLLAGAKLVVVHNATPGANVAVVEVDDRAWNSVIEAYGPPIQS